MGLVARSQAFRNVRARPEVSIVIFDSRVAVGSALAMRMSVKRSHAPSEVQASTPSRSSAS